MSLAVAEAARQSPADAARSKYARRLYRDLRSLDPEVRREFMAGLTPRDLTMVLAAAKAEGGSPYALWQDDAAGFVTDVLRENYWSKSRAILDSVPRHTRTAVPSCFSSSKSWSVSRLVLWQAMVYAPSTTKVVTIAPKWSQVETIIWPEVRRAHARSGLPGHVDMTQLKVPADGMDYKVAWGIAASPYREEAVQGLHAPNLLLVVDEAGGIGHTIGGNLRALLTGDNSRMVAIGNPPSDDEGSWFEGLCANDDVNVIRIPAGSTPNLTGEAVGRCLSCPPEVPKHPLSSHLIQRFQVEETIAEHGEDSPYVQAKVHARFPKGGARRILPYGWLEAAADAPEPDPEGGDPQVLGFRWRRLCDVVPGESREWLVRDGARIAIGADIASDGGDEFAVSRQIGDLFTIEHASAGTANANAVDVAGVILQHIKAAEALRETLGTAERVTVKVDANGVGWGVCGTLEAWGSEGLHDAEIVRVMVSEGTGREPPTGATFRPYRKRDEMWLNMRELLTPLAPGEAGSVRLRVDRKTIAQLSGPMYGTASNGLTTIETKKSLRQRGIPSPDRGEAVLLAAYYPLPPARKGVRVRLLV